MFLGCGWLMQVVLHGETLVLITIEIEIAEVKSSSTFCETCLKTEV